mmetsp:Transcript_18847/g.45026  ORF Transcript_18847/g.45026 Transcript_18847/m.45026 type:complete len:281 (+) Transcript_18847:1539-2381(+)
MAQPASDTLSHIRLRCRSDAKEAAMQAIPWSVTLVALSCRPLRLRLSSLERGLSAPRVTSVTAGLAYPRWSTVRLVSCVRQQRLDTPISVTSWQPLRLRCDSVQRSGASDLRPVSVIFRHQGISRARRRGRRARWPIPASVTCTHPLMLRLVRSVSPRATRHSPSSVMCTHCARLSVDSFGIPDSAPSAWSFTLLTIMRWCRPRLSVVRDRSPCPISISRGAVTCSATWPRSSAWSLRKRERRAPTSSRRGLRVEMAAPAVSYQSAHARRTEAVSAGLRR